MGSYQPVNEYQYKPLGKIFKGEECKSVFNENVIKRYQIWYCYLFTFEFLSYVVILIN